MVKNRMKGHQKVPRKRLCICGKKMLLDKRYSGGWVCLAELEGKNDNSA